MRYLLLLLLLWSLPALAAEPWEKAFAEHGNAAFTAKRYSEAIAAYEQLLQRAPTTSYREDALWTIAQASYAVDDWKRATDAITIHRQAFPKSGRAADATLLAYRLALAQGDLRTATAIWEDLLRRWPRSGQLTQAYTAFCQASLPQNPVGAIRAWAGLANHPLLDAGAPAPLMHSLFTAIQRETPASYPLAACEAIPALMAPATSATDLTPARELAKTLYGPLMSGKQAKTAWTVHTQVQAAYARVQALFSLDALADVQAYLTALERTGSPDYAKHAQQYLTNLCAQAPTADVVQGALPFANTVLAHLLTAKRLPEADAVQTTLLAGLQRVGAPVTVQQQQVASYFAALEKLQPAAYVPAAYAWCGTITPTTPEAAIQLANIAARSYALAFPAGHGKQAEALHAVVHPQLTAGLSPQATMTEGVGYLTAQLAQAQAQDPATALPLVLEGYTTLPLATIEGAKAVLASVNAWYPVLLAAGKVTETEALYTHLQTELRALDGAAVLQATAGAQYATALVTLLLTPPPGLPATTLTAVGDAVVARWRTADADGLDATLPLVRDRWLRAPTRAVHFPVFADAVARTGNADAACLLVGQWAQQLALTRRLAQQDATDLEAQAVRSFTAVATHDTATLAQRQAAVAGLGSLAVTTQTPQPLDRCLAQLTQQPLALEAKAWLADTYTALGTPGDLLAARTLYQTLVTAAPTHAQAPRWQYRLGIIADAQGERAQAHAAYTAVLTQYPESSCAYAAGRRLDALGGRE